MEPIRVLLADDHALFRKGLASMLQDQPDFEVVAEAQDGQEALAKAKEVMPDVILMDIYMPGCDGLKCTQQIKEALPYIKIVMLTVSEEDQNLFSAIQSGAQGYLSKKIDPQELFEMLRGVVKGQAPISRATAAKILDEFARQIKQGREEDAGEQLSPREREVLQLLTKGSTNKEIAATLGISDNTVKNHLRNILDKLHLQNRVQAAAFALRKALSPPHKD